jgi:hypothetical protein
VQKKPQPTVRDLESTVTPWAEDANGTLHRQVHNVADPVPAA